MGLVIGHIQSKALCTITLLRETNNIVNNYKTQNKLRKTTRN